MSFILRTLLWRINDDFTLTSSKSTRPLKRNRDETLVGPESVSKLRCRDRDYIHFLYRCCTTCCPANSQQIEASGVRARVRGVSAGDSAITSGGKLHPAASKQQQHRRTVRIRTYVRVLSAVINIYHVSSVAVSSLGAGGC